MWAKIITIKRTKDLNYFSLCALNLFKFRVSQFELNYWNKWTFPWHSNLLRCTCIMPGCDRLQNSLVSFLNKLQRKTVERDGRCSASGHGFSPTSVHTPSIWEQRILLIFSRFWYLILFTWWFFLAFKFGWVVNNTFFYGVTNSEHTFTWTLKEHHRLKVKLFSCKVNYNNLRRKS